MSKAKIFDLLSESVVSADNSTGRPALLALTRATTKLIYHDLVATQFTTQPVAALFGVKYLNPNKELTFVTGATYGGQYGTAERATMETLDLTNKDTLVKGDLFLYLNTVFKVINDDPFGGSTETDLLNLVTEATAAGNIRMAPEAAETEKFERQDSVISDARFEVNKWQSNVRSRKFKTELTVELAQDMQANGFDAPEMLEDVLATQMAEEINKDVIQSLVTVSTRFKVDGASRRSVLDMSDTTVPAVTKARNLYYYVNEMNSLIQRNTSYSGTYVLGSARAIALLAASGWLKQTEDQPFAAYGVLKNGLTVYCDNNSPVDYILVGVKDYYGEEEMVGSLFYAPYVEGMSEEADITDHVGAYKVVNDSNSLQPRIALLVRYALCVNPYTMGLSDEQARVIDATDMDNFVGRSQMSVMLGLKLPKQDQGTLGG